MTPKEHVAGVLLATTIDVMARARWDGPYNTCLCVWTPSTITRWTWKLPTTREQHATVRDMLAAILATHLYHECPAYAYATIIDHLHTPPLYAIGIRCQDDSIISIWRHTTHIKTMDQEEYQNAGHPPYRIIKDALRIYTE